MRTRLIIALALLALVAAACGDDDAGTRHDLRRGRRPPPDPVKACPAPTLMSLDDVAALFGEPAVFDAGELRGSSAADTVSCVWSSVESADDLEDLQVQLFQIQVYRGAEYYAPEIGYEDVEPIEGIGDDAFFSPQLGVSTGFRDGDRGRLRHLLGDRHRAMPPTPSPRRTRSSPSCAWCTTGWSDPVASVATPGRRPAGHGLQEAHPGGHQAPTRPDGRGAAPAGPGPAPGPRRPPPASRPSQAARTAAASPSPTSATADGPAPLQAAWAAPASRAAATRAPGERRQVGAALLVQFVAGGLGQQGGIPPAQPLHQEGEAGRGAGRGGGVDRAPQRLPRHRGGQHRGRARPPAPAARGAPPGRRPGRRG